MKTKVLFFFFMQLALAYSQNAFKSAAVVQFQNKMNKEFADAKTSPLTPEDRATFKSLAFYPANKSFFVTATLVKTENEQPFEMKTTTDRKPLYVKYGELSFVLKGRSFKLNVYRNIELSKKEEYKDYLFLPFSDATSGKESHVGGRYIDLRVPAGNTITIDFNTAYNPYCAYNSQYSCPIVPLENDLNIAIEAGVKKFHD